MAANTGDFKSGGNAARGDDVGIIPPIAESKATPRSAAAEPYIPLSPEQRRALEKRGLTVDSGASVSSPKPAKKAKPITTGSLIEGYRDTTGKVAVGMNNTITASQGILGKLYQAHATLTGATSEHKDHPDLPEIHKTLKFAEHQLNFANQAKKNVAVLDASGQPMLTKKGNPREANNAAAAWSAISEAGKNIVAGYKKLKSISPDHVQDVSHTVTEKSGEYDVPITLHPEDGLSEATRNIMLTRQVGDSPEVANLAGTMFRVHGNIERNLAVRNREADLGIKGVQPVRRDVQRALKSKLARQPRVPKMLRGEGYDPTRTGAMDPKSSQPMVERFGDAAVKGSGTANWGGSERAPLRPGQGYRRRAERAATKALRGSRTRLESARYDYALASKSDSPEAPAVVKSSRNEILKSAVDVAKNIGQVRAARNRDITYASGTPTDRTRTFPKPKKPNTPKEGTN